MNILEAMSKNTAQSVINVVSSWFGYVPACIYFMTGDNYKIFGDNVTPVVCIFIVGIVVELLRTVGIWIIVVRIDWEKACVEAQERNEEENSNGDENKERDLNGEYTVDGNESANKWKGIDYVNLEDKQHQIV